MRRAASATLAVVPLVLTAGAARAQQPGHGGHAQHAEDAPPVQAEGHGHAMDGGMMPGLLGVPMSRMASGTAWAPDLTPMRAVYVPIGGWDVMIHGQVFVGYDVQGSERGDSQVFSVNWLMLMARRVYEHGELGVRAMVSAEPWTLGGRGYPLLLQSGETWEGAPLHDRQHPHDLAMELAARAAVRLSRGAAVEVYAAAAGEPALGPVAFPHRMSAAADPMAPLGHHWQEATHISFGVLTAGVYTRYVKLEGSWFNGREPDEDRLNLDLRAPDSFAARLSLSPAPELSLQASYGYLDSPEGPEHGSVQRLTASAAVHMRTPAGDRWSALALAGLNLAEEDPATGSYLIEGQGEMDGHHVVFGRAELVRKSGHDLVIPEREDDTFGVAAVAAGYVYDLDPVTEIVPGLGFRASVNFMPESLRPTYGTTVAPGVVAFVRLRPTDMRMDHAGMDHAGSR